MCPGQARAGEAREPAGEAAAADPAHLDAHPQLQEDGVKVQPEIIRPLNICIPILRVETTAEDEDKLPSPS